MNSKRRTGYGTFDLSRQIARRVQKEWETVENAADLARLATTGSVRRASVLPLRSVFAKEKRPLAA